MITGYLLNMYKKFLSVRNGACVGDDQAGPLSLLIKKINKENAPPDGWALPDKLKPSSSQAFKLDRSGELG
jgi:hypothetical protein